jgi:predicted permease
MNETEKRAQAASNVLNTILLWFAMIVGYWLPSLVAFHRKHKNRMAITVANLFVGWTIVGWIVSLIWAFTSNVETVTR